MLRRESRDSDLFILINDPGFDLVGVHLPTIGKATLVSVGIRTRLDVHAICLQYVLGHRLQTTWPIDLEPDCTAGCPSTKDQVRVASSVIGMKVRHECHFEISGFDCRNVSLEGCGLSAAHNTRSEIDEVSAIINNDGGGRA